MAGILTPTVREFWRAYIEKTRETTSTIDTTYIEASCDPYINPPTLAHYQTPTTPYIEATSPATSPATKLPPTLTPIHIGLHLPLLPLPLHYLVYYPCSYPYYPLSLSLERGFAPLPQCASRTGPPLPIFQNSKISISPNFSYLFPTTPTLNTTPLLPIIIIFIIIFFHSARRPFYYITTLLYTTPTTPNIILLSYNKNQIIFLLPGPNIIILLLFL